MALSGALLAGGASLLGGMLGRNNNRRNQKQNDALLNQIPGILKQYQEPYINAGQTSLSNLGDISHEYQNQYQDPNAIISRLGSGYKQSPGYQWQLNQGENYINNAAARGGMVGTGQHQQQAGELAENLANKDYQDYLSEVLGLRQGGLTGRTGIESGIFNTGANASTNLSEGLANNLFARAGLNYQHAGNQNALYGNLLKGLIALLTKS